MSRYSEPANAAIVKAFILADPVLGPKAPLGPLNDWGFIWNALNAPTSPAFIVWRGIVGRFELRAAALVGATQLDALTASKRDSLLWAISEDLDFSVAANRAAIDDLCGSQNTLKAALVAVQKRTCTVAEKLFATGTGTIAVPATAGITGPVQIDVIGTILSTP